MGPGKLIELALEAYPVLAAPEQTDDLHRLLQRRDGLARCSHRTVVRLDPLPEPACSEAELDPAATQKVERRRGLRKHRRRTQRQVRDVREDGQALRAHGDRGQQRPGVDEAPMVWMILNAVLS